MYGFPIVQEQKKITDTFGKYLGPTFLVCFFTFFFKVGKKQHGTRFHVCFLSADECTQEEKNLHFASFALEFLPDKHSKDPLFLQSEMLILRFLFVGLHIREILNDFAACHFRARYAFIHRILQPQKYMQILLLNERTQKTGASLLRFLFAYSSL